jgi:hypothetical protein
LRFGRTPGGRFLLGGFGAPCLHLALVEPHGADFAAAGSRESSGRGKTRQMASNGKSPGREGAKTGAPIQ